MKSKKSSGEMWWIIISAFVALVIAGVLIFGIPKGLFAQQKNIDYLSSCKNQGGICKTECEPDEKSFFRFGCPFDKNGDNKIDDNEKEEEYCCIPIKDG